MATALAPGYGFPGQAKVRMSEGDVVNLAKACGLPGVAFMQIAKGESGLYADVQQRDPGDGMVGYGLLQMTPNAWGAGAAKQEFNRLGGIPAMKNPVKNMMMARFLYRSAGNSVRPWYGIGFLTDRSGIGSLGNLDRSALARFEAKYGGGGNRGPGGNNPEADASGGDPPSRSRTITITKPYAFSRKKDEGSWPAMARLAEEVNWRLFVSGNDIVYADEPTLYRQNPVATLDPTADPYVLGFDFDLDWNRRTGEADLKVVLGRWAMAPGSVVVLEDAGPASGRWLVKSVRRSLFDPVAEVSLVQPSREKLEPAPETETKTVGGGGGPGTTASTPSTDSAASSSGGGLGPCWTGGKKRVSSPYGVPRPGHIHGGTDVEMPVGVSCTAPCDGTITLVAGSGFGEQGGMIHMRPSGAQPGLRAGDIIGWGHAVGATVRVGQKVRKGQKVGVSNYSKAPHVHFIRRTSPGGMDGNADPLAFLKASGSV